MNKVKKVVHLIERFEKKWPYKRSRKQNETTFADRHFQKKARWSLKTKKARKIKGNNGVVFYSIFIPLSSLVFKKNPPI